MAAELTFAILVLQTFIVSIRTNQFDPHVFPSEGPFFEGWYIRLTDFSINQTFGVLFGSVLPKDNISQEHKASPGLVSILHREGSFGDPLRAHHALLKRDQIHVTLKDGQPVTKDPDDVTPAFFTWNATNVGYIKVRPTWTEFSFTAEHLRFSGIFGAPEPWGPYGEGPEGWLSKLPLPLHWFVYSLRSPVLKYELLDLRTNTSISGRNVVAHMEKNWGKSFPKAWIWAEGSSNQNVSLALSGGLGTFDKLLNVPAYLIGYRNPAKDIDLDFRPDDSIIKVVHEGCQGTVSIVAQGIRHILEVNISGPLRTFSDCLYGPEEAGFERACVESYDSIATTVVKKREFLKPAIMIDEQTIINSALEFGGEYVCGNKCKIT